MPYCVVSHCAAEFEQARCCASWVNLERLKEFRRLLSVETLNH